MEAPDTQTSNREDTKDEQLQVAARVAKDRPPVATSEERPSTGGSSAVKASPGARRIAQELGVDLSAVTGTGPGGRIVRADVEARSRSCPPAVVPRAPDGRPVVSSAAPPRSAPVAVETDKPRGDVLHEKLSRAQQVVARRMAESHVAIPDFAVTVDVDVSVAVAMRTEFKASGDHPVPSFNDFVVKAVSLALREHPRANGAFHGGHLELYSRVNVGIAVAAEDSLLVPTVFDADLKSLGRIASESRTLAERVRAGVITPAELSGGTFTVSNLGMFGIDDFTAVINLRQAAILAVGAVRDTPVVENGEIVPGKRMRISLCSDHRVLYGANAAHFLSRVRQLLEHPIALAGHRNEPNLNL